MPNNEVLCVTHNIFIECEIVSFNQCTSDTCLHLHKGLQAPAFPQFQQMWWLTATTLGPFRHIYALWGVWVQSGGWMSGCKRRTRLLSWNWLFKQQLECRAQLQVSYGVDDPFNCNEFCHQVFLPTKLVTRTRASQAVAAGPEEEVMSQAGTGAKLAEGSCCTVMYIVFDSMLV